MALTDAVARGDFAVVAAHPLPFPEPGVEAAEELHEVADNLLLLMAALPVPGVVVESRAMNTSLLRPMLFGRRT
jgi:hypothetical protein